MTLLIFPRFFRGPGSIYDLISFEKIYYHYKLSSESAVPLRRV